MPPISVITWTPVEPQLITPTRLSFSEKSLGHRAVWCIAPANVSSPGISGYFCLDRRPKPVIRYLEVTVRSPMAPQCQRLKWWSRWAERISVLRCMLPQIMFLHYMFEIGDDFSLLHVIFFKRIAEEVVTVRGEAVDVALCVPHSPTFSVDQVRSGQVRVATLVQDPSGSCHEAWLTEVPIPRSSYVSGLVYHKAVEPGISKSLELVDA